MPQNFQVFAWDRRSRLSRFPNFPECRFADNRVILRQLVQLPISKRYCSLSVRMRSARELSTELDGLSILSADFQSRQSRRRRAHASAARRRIRRSSGTQPTSAHHAHTS